MICNPGDNPSGNQTYSPDINPSGNPSGLTCNIIATGSRGNAVVLGGTVLIDCGVPYKALRPVAGDLSLVLLTHSHSDHFRPSTVQRLARARPGIRFGCGEWMTEPLIQAGVPARRIDLLPMSTAVSYGNGLFVRPVPLVHDVPNCGYVVQMDDRTAFYATDTATLDGITVKADLYLIEANYEDEELKERIRRKEAAGEYVYEYRAANNHLSEQQAIDWLTANAPPGSEYRFLHRHREEAQECS